MLGLKVNSAQPPRPRRVALWAAAVALYSGLTCAQVAFPDLNDIQLRCCALVEKPYVFKSSSGLTGLAVEYVRSLENALNFSCTSLVEYEEENDEFQGFTGLTKYFDDCAVNGDSAGCSCDLAVSGFANTKERVTRVSFPAAFAFDSFSVVQRIDEIRNTAPGSIFFLAPFTFGVWAGVLSLIILPTLVTLFDRRFVPPRTPATPAPNLSPFQIGRHVLLRANPLRRFRYAFFQTAFSMVGADPGRPANSRRNGSVPTRQRFLQLFAVLTGLFMTLVYESGLVLQLFLDNPVSEFRSVDDVKNCRLAASDFCVPAGGATQDFWKFAIEAARDNCRTSTLERDQPSFVSSGGAFPDPFSAGLDAVAKKECRFFLALSSTMTVATENTYCGTLSVVGETFFPVSISVVLPKGSNLTEAFSVATMNFQQEDTLQTPVEYGAPRKCNTVVTNVLDWNRLGLFFYVAWTVYFFMLLFMWADQRPPAQTDAKNQESDSDIQT